MSIISCTSPLPSTRILPFSTVTSSPSWSLAARSSSPSSRISSPRFGAGTSRQAANPDAGDLLAVDRRASGEIPRRQTGGIEVERLEQCFEIHGVPHWLDVTASVPTPDRRRNRPPPDPLQRAGQARCGVADGGERLGDLRQYRRVVDRGGHLVLLAVR